VRPEITSSRRRAMTSRPMPTGPVAGRLKILIDTCRGGCDPARHQQADVAADGIAGGVSEHATGGLIEGLMMPR
jgi:hypothetical protein